MTQTMDLNKMGLAPMSELEMNEIDGGFWLEIALVGVAFIMAAAYEAGKNCYTYDKAHNL